MSTTLRHAATAALDVLSRLDGALPDVDQARVLAGWPGWGPLAGMFGEQPGPEWDDVRRVADRWFDQQPAAWDDASLYLDTQFFTPAWLVDAMWAALAAAGVSGRVLEPGCGSGRFMARVPAGLDVQVVGVEADLTAAAIARATNPGHEVIHARLEKTSLPAGSFTAAIGNVPFSQSSVNDPAVEWPLRSSLNRYATARALAALADGGLACLVASRHLLDATNARDLADDPYSACDLLDAARLNGGAFTADGTGVVADVLLLARRCDGPTRPWPKPVHLDGGRWDADERRWSAWGARNTSPVVSSYWLAHPGRVAGVMEATGFERIPLAVSGGHDDNLRVVGALAATAADHPVAAVVAGDPFADVALCDADGRPEGSFHLVDGAMHQVRDARLVPVRGSRELAALVGLRDAAAHLLALEADTSLPDEVLDGARQACRDLWRGYVQRFGPLNRGTLVEGRPDPDTGQPRTTWRRPTMGGFRRDPDHTLVLALEVFDPDTGTATEAPLLLRRVNRAPVPVVHADSPAEAVQVSLSDLGRIDVDRVAGLLGTTPDRVPAALEGVAFRDPRRAGQWVEARTYLSGDVVDALAAARRAAAADPAYLGNVEALERVQPAPLGPLDITCRLGAAWVPADVYRDFAVEVLGYTHASVSHFAPTATWEVTWPGKGSRYRREAPSEWNTGRMDAGELLAHALRGRMPVVWDEDGNGRKVRNQAETVAACDRVQQMAERFEQWVWTDADRSRLLCDVYNRRFNCFRLRRADGSGLRVDGLADGVELWPHQLDAVDLGLSADAVLVAHQVGLGKTLTMLAWCMKARQVGAANKPLVVVPNNILEQVAAEARRAFPMGRFLVATDDDMTRDRRRLFAARCATGDWDAVVMTHSAFAMVPVDPQVEADWLREQLSQLEDALRDAGDEAGRFAAKDVARRKRSLQSRLEALAGKRSVDPLTFGQLGVDLLAVDEAHCFRRLPVVSVRAEGFSFGTSKRAVDLFLKARQVKAAKPGRPALMLATGTPWANTLAETFIWQQYLQPQVLAAAGVDTFDAWAATFVTTTTAVEVAPEGGGYRMATRPSGLCNVAELRTMLSLNADVRTADDAGLVVPRADLSVVTVGQRPRQRAFVEDLAVRADRLRAGGGGSDNMLAVCGDGQRAALDPRLVGLDEDSTKLEAVARDTAEAWRRLTVRDYGGSRPGGLQVLFCDQGTPGARGAQAYGRLRDLLVSMGVPADQVAFVHDATTAKQKEALFASCRDGRVQVLVGSTAKMGLGTNIQHRLAVVRDVDAPWRPCDLEQRHGRALRPGNSHDVVEVVRYVTERSFDAYMWQALERKQVQVQQMFTSADVREVEDIGEVLLDFAAVKALAAGNADLVELARVRAEVRRLRMLRSVDAQQVTEARSRAGRNRRRAEAVTAGIAAAAEPAGHLWGAVGGFGAAARQLREQVRARKGAGGQLVALDGFGFEVHVDGDGGTGRVRYRSLVLRVRRGYRNVDRIRLDVALLRRSPDVLAEALGAAARAWLDGRDGRLAELAAEATDLLAEADRLERQAAAHRFGRAGELEAAERRERELVASIELAARDHAA